MQNVFRSILFSCSQHSLFPKKVSVLETFLGKFRKLAEKSEHGLNNKNVLEYNLPVQNHEG